MTTATEVEPVVEALRTFVRLDEEVVHVVPSAEGWRVKPEKGKESIHSRKALAALFAKQIAANAPKNGRVIFYRADGSVEVERTFECLITVVRQ